MVTDDTRGIMYSSNYYALVVRSFRYDGAAGRWDRVGEVELCKKGGKGGVMQAGYKTVLLLRLLQGRDNTVCRWDSDQRERRWRVV